MASTINVNSSTSSKMLQQLLLAEDIEPGSDPSYQLCKTIYEYHPLGQKMAESPVVLAQSQARDIAIPDSPETRVKDAFLKEWTKIGADKHILNVMKLSRIYGIASMSIVEEDVETDSPLDLSRLAGARIGFNAFDPLNTAGSLVLNQDANAIDFQKHGDIVVNGKRYHRSRSVVVLNEQPIYIGYTSSAFGFVGRSVYQRALFPLKSFVQSMMTDDMVTRKAGLLIAKQKQAGSIADSLMSKAAGMKRELLKQAKTDNVLSISVDEAIESLNLQNLDGAHSAARTNILKNIATAADMPAKLLDNETLVSGFGEGTEDAKNIARYIETVRAKMEPLYEWFDAIVQHRAWNAEFYATIQNDYPEYRNISYEEAFYRWRNSFTAAWPNLLSEPDSDKAKTEKVKFEALMSTVSVLAPLVDAENKSILLEWFADNLNENKLLFPNPLVLDPDALRNAPLFNEGSEEEAPEEQPEEPQPKKLPKLSLTG